MDTENEIFKQFMVILINITKEQTSEEDKAKSYWEKALIE